jgi:hypothetical protein
MGERARAGWGEGRTSGVGRGREDFSLLTVDRRGVVSLVDIGGGEGGSARPNTLSVRSPRKDVSFCVGGSGWLLGLAA